MARGRLVARQDYIRPARCSDVEFRQMWSEFEWENKVTISAPGDDVDAYLATLLKTTNMEWCVDDDDDDDD